MFKFPTIKFPAFPFMTQSIPPIPPSAVSPAKVLPATLPAKTGKTRPAAKKPDSDGKMRRMRQTVENNRFL